MTRKVNAQGAEARRKILEYIIGYSDRIGFPPTIREILESLHIGSESTVLYHLGVMEREGSIERTPMTARGIRIPDKTRRDYSVEYRCLYPFGCTEKAAKPGDCQIHGTELVPFVTRRKNGRK